MYSASIAFSSVTWNNNKAILCRATSQDVILPKWLQWVIYWFYCENNASSWNLSCPLCSRIWYTVFDHSCWPTKWLAVWYYRGCGILPVNGRISVYNLHQLFSTVQGLHQCANVMLSLPRIEFIFVVVHFLIPFIIVVVLLGITG